MAFAARMDPVMNARGTRRPHARTPRSRAVKVSRRGGGDDVGGKSFVRELLGCAVIAAALLALPFTLLADVIWGALS